MFSLSTFFSVIQSRSTAALLVVVLLVAGSPSLYANNPTAQPTTFVLASHEWQPFASRENRFFGLVPRIASELLLSQNIEVKYRFMHWSDSLNGIITEEYDGALVWLMDDLRHDAFLISEPILRYRSALYYRQDFPRPKEVNDLLGFRMAINPHYVYNTRSYNLLKNKMIEPLQSSNDIHSFQLLLDGEVDFFLTPLLTSKPILQTRFSPEQRKMLRYNSSIFKFPSSHLIVNKHRAGSLEFMTQFNTGLERLRNNGTIDRYIEDIRLNKY